MICISNNTKNDLFEFMPNLNKDIVKTIYISADEEFFPIEDSKSNIMCNEFNEIKDKKIILFVGDRKSTYKNFNLAVETLSHLRDFLLVSVGSGPITHDEKKIIDKKIGERFYHFQNISKRQLNILYNLSYCLLPPSVMKRNPNY